MNYYDTRRQEARRIRNMTEEEARRDQFKRKNELGFVPMSWEEAGRILYPKAYKVSKTGFELACGGTLWSRYIPGFVDVCMFHEHGFYKVRVFGKNFQKQTLSFKRFKDARKHFNQEKIKRIEEWEPKEEIDVFSIF